MKIYRKEKKKYYLMTHLPKITIAAINLIAGKVLIHLIIWNNITKNVIEKSSCSRRIAVKNAIIIFRRRVKKQPMKFFTSINQDEIVYHLALHLGLPFVPSYLVQSGSIEQMVLGFDYASSGVDIIFSTGSELGQHCLFYISIGSNDYIHYYIPNASNVLTVYLPWSFNQFLAQTIKQEIKNLYNDKVRKVVVMGLAPIGCAPYYLWLYSSENGECVKNINDMILEFNFAVRYMVSELNEELVDATIIFCDAFEGSMDSIQNYNLYGFNVTDEACCGLGEYKGWIMCVSPEMACNNTPLATSGGINSIRLML